MRRKERKKAYMTTINAAIIQIHFRTRFPGGLFPLLNSLLYGLLLSLDTALYAAAPPLPAPPTRRTGSSNDQEEPVFP